METSIWDIWEGPQWWYPKPIHRCASSSRRFFSSTTRLSSSSLRVFSSWIRRSWSKCHRRPGKPMCNQRRPWVSGFLPAVENSWWNCPARHPARPSESRNLMLENWRGGCLTNHFQKIQRIRFNPPL